MEEQKDDPDEYYADQGETIVDFHSEAKACLSEIAYAVKLGELSTRLPSSHDCVYMNLQTIEDAKFCIKLSMQGFQVVANDFDCCDFEADPVALQSLPTFETVYALLHAISQSYDTSFSTAVAERLEQGKPTTTH